VPKITPSKITPPQPEKKLPPRDKKMNKQDELVQALFDYVVEDIHAPVASSSSTSETSKTPEPVIDKLKYIKSVSKIINIPSKETSVKRDLPKPNEVSSAILLFKTQREERLRKKAIELGENPDVFVTITEKNRLDFIRFWNKIETDSQMCA